jgi:hypothetical protein
MGKRTEAQGKNFEQQIQFNESYFSPVTLWLSLIHISLNYMYAYTGLFDFITSWLSGELVPAERFGISPYSATISASQTQQWNDSHHQPSSLLRSHASVRSVCIKTVSSSWFVMDNLVRDSWAGPKLTMNVIISIIKTTKFPDPSR